MKTPSIKLITKNRGICLVCGGIMVKRWIPNRGIVWSHLPYAAKQHDLRKTQKDKPKGGQINVEKA